MTTAPDLPLPVAPVPLPAAPAQEQQALRLVPCVPQEDGEVSFEAALGRAMPRLRRYAVRRLGDDHEAEEVAQEAMLRAFQHREKFRTEDDLMAWLTVVTGRLVIDRVRVRGRSTPVAEVDPTARAGRDTADVVVAKDEARIALDALEAMPGRQASVLWAREVEGLSYEEIGDRYAMTAPSVRSLLHRARHTLRREYAARGGTLPAVGLVALAPWLRGLRHAGRLHRIARQGAITGALAATGFIAVAGSPLTIAPPAHSQAPRTSPAVHVQTSAATHHHASSAGHATGAAVVAHPTAVSPATPAPATAGRQDTRLPTPSVCNRSAAGHSVSVGCNRPHQSMLRVKLPVTVGGKNYVGVTNNNIDCTQIPNTPVTDCRPGTDWTQGTP